MTRRQLSAVFPKARGLAMLALAVFPPSCGGGGASGGSGTSTAPTPAQLTFRASPLDEASIVTIVPLGNLNPPDHTLPTDHIYINNRRSGEPPVSQAPVYAPGDGTVQFIIQNGSEAKVGVRTGTATYYLDHVVLDASVQPGSTLTAGQRIGSTGAATLGVDLGVINDLKTNAFSNPARYSTETLHGDAPLRFFEEPLRTRMYSRVPRAGSDKDGRFDYDMNGRLVGNWFAEGLAPSASSAPSAWSQHLAFVFDNYAPDSVRVSIGGTLPLVGAFAVPADSPSPSEVTPSSGTVTYRLLVAAGNSPGPQRGIMIVQMLDTERIRVEVTEGSSATSAEFTGASRIYVR